MFLVAGKPKYIHLGAEVDGVDMRAEVGLLSRNILVRGEMESSCYGNEACKFFDFDTFGGHLKVGNRVAVLLNEQLGGDYNATVVIFRWSGALRQCILQEWSSSIWASRHWATIQFIFI